MFQKQPPKVCCEKKVFLKFGKLHWKTSVMKSLFKKVVGLKTCNFIKKRHRCFPVNIAKLSKTSILKKIYERLLEIL